MSSSSFFNCHLLAYVFVTASVLVSVSFIFVFYFIFLYSRVSTLINDIFIILGLFIILILILILLIFLRHSYFSNSTLSSKTKIALKSFPFLIISQTINTTTHLIILLRWRYNISSSSAISLICSNSFIYFCLSCLFILFF